MKERARKTIALSLVMLLLIALFSTTALASESDLKVENSSTSNELNKENTQDLKDLKEYIPIMPLSLRAPGIAFIVRDSASNDVLLQTGMYAPTSQPPYNLARITDRGFDMERWAGWRVHSWNSNYTFGIPASTSEDQVILEVGTGSLNPPPIPYETIPAIAGSSELLGSNFSWLAHPTFSVWIEPVPPTITKTLETTTPIYPGEFISFSITVSNPAILPNLWSQISFPGPPPFPEALGPSISTTLFDGFRVIDDLEAAGLILVEDSITIEGERGAVNNQSSYADNILELTLNLPHAKDASTAGVITIKYQAQIPTSATVGMPITNVAKLMDGDGQLVDEDDVTTTVEKPPTPKIEIKKTASQTDVEKGGDVTYTLVVTNTGEESLNDVVVIDILDDLLTNPRKESSTHGTCSFVGKTLTANIGTLKPEEYATITFVVTVDKDAKDGSSIPNIAFTSGVGERSKTTVEDEDPAIITIPDSQGEEGNDTEDEKGNNVDDGKDTPTDENGSGDEKGAIPKTGNSFLSEVFGYGSGILVSLVCVFCVMNIDVWWPCKYRFHMK